jgi:PKD repeat protein
MPSFILRNLNPEFWSQVQAKAARDGMTVKALILKLLTAWLAAVLVLGLTAGCSPKSLTAPTPIVEDATAPYTLTLGALAGEGADAGHGAITAKVQNLHGVVLPGVLVQFSTDVGTLSVASMLTSANGMAATTITATSSATVTATAGTLTTHTLVTSQPLPVPPATPTPIPTPPPSAPGGSLSLSLSASAVTLGSQTIVTANAAGATWPYSLTWDFGDGSGTTSASASTGHTYGALGLYVITAVVRDADGRTAHASTTALVSAVPVVTPTPTPALAGLVATLTCTPVAHGNPTACNVAVTYNGPAVASGAVSRVDWDWGDGTAHIVNNSPLDTRVYAQAGTYRVEANVTASTVDGAKMTKVSTSLVIP